MASEKWSEKWIRGDELGQGGQGTTFIVSHRDDPASRGVLKLLRNPTDLSARRRMAREAINLGSLAEAGAKVPRVLDHNALLYEQTGTEIYIVMDLVPGQTLNKVVAPRGKLPLNQAAAIALDLCETISKLHLRDVLHRDLKPANLMVRSIEPADVVVLDLGLSYDGAGEQETVTIMGEKIKNELLSLPEATMVGGNRRDARSDVTNIVAVLFYCLTGSPPDQLLDQRGLMPHKRSGLTTKDILGSDPHVQDLNLLFDVGFAFDIGQRFQSVQDLTDRLRDLLKERTHKRDPIKLAKEMKEHLIRTNRSVQLDALRNSAQGHLNAISNYVNGSLRGHVDPFSMELIGIATFNCTLPAGCDVVPAQSIGIRVSMQTSDQQKLVVFLVAAQGSQCGLFYSTADLPKGGRITNKMTGSPGKLMFWYDPAVPVAAERLKEGVDEIVVEAMDFFRPSGS